ncbi:MAG: carbohydrate kinase [Cytophagales bacterium]|nr:carbohydrate kinase [Cytophagales bacterium]
MIAIFDIGKTNKKFYLFGQNYQILHQEEHNFAETEDEDGFPSEDLSAVAQWVTSTLRAAKADRRFQIKALNFSTYGASAVHLDDHNRVVTPLYNYLKPLEPQILEQLAQHHGQLEQLALDTACPMPLDNLNVGLQMYRLRCLRPDTFDRIHVSLHLPQYLSFLFTGVPTCAKSMIGCHSLLWDFDHDKYHPWALNAGVTQKFVPIRACTSAVQKGEMHIGPGMHDSAASLVPYMVSPSAQPFVLLSTGTWSIAMNPSNDQALTLDELRQGCLKYMNYLGKGVKSSRLFMGQEHEQQVNQIAAHFHVQPDFYKTVVYQPELAEQLGTGSTQPQAPAHAEGAWLTMRPTARPQRPTMP